MSELGRARDITDAFTPYDGLDGVPLARPEALRQFSNNCGGRPAVVC